MTSSTRRAADYEIGGVVGQGVAGAIHDGLYAPTGQPVVLEEVPAAMAADAAFTRRLATAGRAASGLASQHLLGTYDVVTAEGGALFVVSEPPGGPSLAVATATKPLPTAAAIAVACDLLAGLAALHAAAMHHGAVSAATVWITASGDARLGEVALSTARSAGSKAGDLESVTTLLTSLLGDTALPVRLAAALKRAPGRRDTNPYTTAAEYLAALEDAAGAVFGPEWRRTSGLGERARQAPQSPPAIELAAAAGAITAPIATRPPAAPAAPVRAPRRRRRRLLWILGALVLIAAVGAGSWLVATRLIEKPTATGPLTVGADLVLTVTPAKGGCDTTFGFVATASVTGSGTLTYRWERNGAAGGPTQSVAITGDDASFRLTQAWRLDGAQQFKGTMTFHILAPANRTVSKSFTYACS